MASSDGLSDQQGYYSKVLEAEALSGGRFRCCKHKWSATEDRILWREHKAFMQVKRMTSGDFLSGHGWKMLEVNVNESTGHAVGLHYLQARYYALIRSKLDLEGEGAFGDNYWTAIMYGKWYNNNDRRLLEWHEEIMTAGVDLGKKFLNGDDWKDMQNRYEQCFGCKPALSHLQKRTLMLLRKKKEKNEAQGSK